MRDKIAPYMPAFLTILVGVILSLVFQRPIRNWFEGRPVLVGEPSRTVTVDAGPYRVGLAVRPAEVLDGENAIFIGVGDDKGILLGNVALSVFAGDIALEVERGTDGQFRVDVDVPESGKVSVKVVIDGPLGRGEAGFGLEAGRTGLIVDGRQDGVAYFTCPMHPSIRAPSQTPCPICGMDLVPVTHEEVSSGSVRIDARRRQLIGVTTANIEKMPFRVKIRMTGIATWDETKLVDVTARADGWVEELFADFTGKSVEKGAPLLSLNVPEIRAAELELLAAAKGRRLAEGTPLAESSGQLQTAARDKLRALGVSDEDLRQILRSGKPEPALVIRAPFDGVIAEKMVKRGSPVMMNQPILRIGTLDPMWVEAHVYEQDSSLVHLGLEAEVEFPYLRGGPRKGTVTFIEPTLDEETRTMRLRISLPNPPNSGDHEDGQIRPGMYADATVEVTLPARLVVPESAVIFAGPRKVVFVDEGGGMMRPVEVGLGLRGEDGYEVERGLEEGVRVVTSGNFLIGAESRLRSALGTF